MPRFLFGSHTYHKPDPNDCGSKEPPRDDGARRYKLPVLWRGTNCFLCEVVPPRADNVDTDTIALASAPKRGAAATPLPVCCGVCWVVGCSCEAYAVDAKLEFDADRIDAAD